MSDVMIVDEGYYWCSLPGDNDSTFIALREDDEWWLPGVDHPVTFKDYEVIGRVQHIREVCNDPASSTMPASR
jgi:hypothetical protein